MQIIDELCKDCNSYKDDCKTLLTKKSCGIRQMRGANKMSIYKKLLNVQITLKVV